MSIFHGSKYFTYNNKSSRNVCGQYKSLKIIRTDGNFNQPFGHKANMIEEKNFKYMPIAYGYQNQPLESIKLEICLVDERTDVPIPLTDKDRKQIAEYLFKNKYCPLTPDETPDLIYMAIITSGEKMMFNCAKDGYISVDIHFRDSCPTTREIISNFTKRDNQPNVAKLMTVENLSNVREYSYPTVIIEPLDGATNITITNMQTNEIISFKNIPTGCVITMNSLLELIETNVEYKYGLNNNFNWNFLSLQKGMNYFNITGGNCKITIQAIYNIGI